MSMASSDSRSYAARFCVLRALTRATSRALKDIQDIVPFDPDIPDIVQEIGRLSSRPRALVILGSCSAARARLVNSLLAMCLLPKELPRGCRWLRIQYGSSTRVHLTLGDSDFEIIEELESNKKPWDTLPLKDLLREKRSDLTTILEVELNNSILKDGLQIIMPPDIGSTPGPATYFTLKQLHSDLYIKRENILKTVNPVYLYALDAFGRNIFNENMCLSKITPSRCVEDFWSTFNLYYMTRIGREKKEEVIDKAEEVFDGSWITEDGSAVFSAENCLDLHQINEIDPNSQVLFVMFSDSASASDRPVSRHEAAGSSEFGRDCAACAGGYSCDLPESDRELIQDGVLRRTLEAPERDSSRVTLIERQTAFMVELLDQWGALTGPPQKYHVKSQWALVDDREILRSPDKSNLADRTNLMCAGDGTIRSWSALRSAVLKYARQCSQTQILAHCTKLSEIHVRLLQQFILCSFELARELQVVPRKIQYVARREHELFEILNKTFSEGDKRRELLQIMQEVLLEIKADITDMDWAVDDLPYHADMQYACASAHTPPRGAAARPDAHPLAEEAVPTEGYNVSLDDYEIINIDDESSASSGSFRTCMSVCPSALSSSVNTIRVESGCEETSASYSWAFCRGSNVSSKQASLDVQRTVLSKLSRKISSKLVSFVDCVRETYFGTLQRCLASLETSCRQELGGRPASEAMRQLLSVARLVDLQPCASFSFLRGLLDSMMWLFHRLRVVCVEADEACCVLSPVWRRQVALHTLNSFTPARLVRLISAQILERLSEAHERYQSALVSLATPLSGRLHHTEDVKLTIRKKLAPAFAKLCLESTSICDLIMHGIPELGRQIGRGQYGVVYAVKGAWAGHTPVAVKSVLPDEEHHYQQLAMEFFYTRSIPAHPRIVRLLGSLVQRGGGGAPGVLLVSERWARDLHAAVRAGLGARARMRIACDIVEGIRYLHSLGLVHRDVKLNNVLLDGQSRAALSDLGFCAAGPLMAGSVVGTPIHMAPELLDGNYDASVDVYAFGILFWYLCAGHTALPAAFEYINTGQLWSKVKLGRRPERLPQFTDECWNLMNSCWASEPSQRALLGDVQPKLEEIFCKTRDNQSNRCDSHANTCESSVNTCDSCVNTCDSCVNTCDNHTNTCGEAEDVSDDGLDLSIQYGEPMKDLNFS